MPCKIWSLKIEFFRSLIFWVHHNFFGNYHCGWSCSICRRAMLASRQWFEWNLGIRVIHKVRRLGGENGQFRLNRASNMWLGMKILQNKITGTQTSFSSNFGCKLSCILSFLFPERLHFGYIYFPCSYLYACYNYSQTLCIKCWVSAFHTEI
jgi:hypothetical protein